MARPLLIFGAGQIAELAKFYFERDDNYRVMAFVLDDEFIKSDSYSGCPIVPMTELSEFYPASAADAFIAVSYSGLNGLRKQKYSEFKRQGYRLATYLSCNATVLNGGAFGDNCFILEDNTIQPYVHIGNNVILWSGNHIGHHSRIGDHTFIASHTVISGGVTVGEQCFIGVNVTVRDHVSIGDRCVIGAGALILGDTAAEGVYSAEATPRSKVPSSRLRGI